MHGERDKQGCVLVLLDLADKREVHGEILEVETRGHRLKAVSEGLRVGKMFFASLIKPLL